MGQGYLHQLLNPYHKCQLLSVQFDFDQEESEPCVFVLLLASYALITTDLSHEELGLEKGAAYSEAFLDAPSNLHLLVLAGTQSLSCMVQVRSQALLRDPPYALKPENNMVLCC